MFRASSLAVSAALVAFCCFPALAGGSFHPMPVAGRMGPPPKAVAIQPAPPSKAQRPVVRIEPRKFDRFADRDGRFRRDRDDRFFRRDRNINMVGGVILPDYDYPAPVASTDYAPVERPLASVYGEPPVIRDPCGGPAIYHMRPNPHAANLPVVIYGIQPQCGPSQAMDPRPAVRAAY